MNPYDKTTYTIEGWDNHLLPVPLPTIQTTTVIDGVTYLLMGPEVLRKALSLGHPIQGEAVAWRGRPKSPKDVWWLYDTKEEAVEDHPDGDIEPLFASQPPTPAGVRENDNG